MSCSILTQSAINGSHDQADAEWIVIRTQLWGHKNMPFRQPTPVRPSGRPGSGRPLGVFCMFYLLLISNVIHYYGLPLRGTRSLLGFWSVPFSGATSPFVLKLSFSSSSLSSVSDRASLATVPYTTNLNAMDMMW